MWPRPEGADLKRAGRVWPNGRRVGARAAGLGVSGDRRDRDTPLGSPHGSQRESSTSGKRSFTSANSSVSHFVSIPSTASSDVRNRSCACAIRLGVGHLGEGDHRVDPDELLRMKGVDPLLDLLLQEEARVSDALGDLGEVHERHRRDVQGTGRGPRSPRSRRSRLDRGTAPSRGPRRR